MSFLSKIVGLEADSATMRSVATLFWISVIYAVLLFVNLLLFEQAAAGSWRARAPKLFQDLLRVLLVVIGAAIVLSVVWRRDLGGLVAALGVGSIVLGLALQETLGNLMSGIAMLFERPFSIGDWIEVGTSAAKWCRSTGAPCTCAPSTGTCWSFPTRRLAAKRSSTSRLPRACRPFE